MKGPIKLTCPLCEKPVYRVDHRSNFTKKGLNATIWFHTSMPPCFVIDDLFPDDRATPMPGTPFEIVPIKEPTKNARA